MLIPSLLFAQESWEDRALIQIGNRLENGESISAILSDTSYNSLRNYPEGRTKFRRIIKEYPEEGALNMVSEFEPGEPLIIRGQLVSTEGVPLANSKLYFFQTDSSGLYAPDKLQGGHGSENPRLIGYVNTREDGSFEVMTIVPGCYPPNNRSLKHIHFEILRGTRWIQREMIFDEPPRPPSANQRSWAGRNKYPIVKRTTDNQGISVLDLQIKM